MHLVEVKPAFIFSALADPTRVRIIRLLAASNEEACLCEFVDSLQEPQYKLSRHVKILRQAGLLSATREGRFIYHQLIRDVSYLESLYSCVLVLPDAEGLFKNDLKRFKKRMVFRTEGRCKVEDVDKAASTNSSRQIRRKSKG